MLALLPVVIIALMWILVWFVRDDYRKWRRTS